MLARWPRRTQTLPPQQWDGWLIRQQTRSQLKACFHYSCAALRCALRVIVSDSHDIASTAICSATYRSLSLTTHSAAAVETGLKYVDFTTSYIFQPIAVENLSPINSSVLSFLNNLGQRICTVSGDDREALFLSWS